MAEAASTHQNLPSPLGPRLTPATFLHLLAGVEVGDMAWFLSLECEWRGQVLPQAEAGERGVPSPRPAPLLPPPAS